MSSILKALKKLEEEQAGRATSPHGGGQFVSPVRSPRPLVLVLGGILAGVMLVVGLYAVFGGQSAGPPPSSPTPVFETAAVTPAPLAETMSVPSLADQSHPESSSGSAAKNPVAGIRSPAKPNEAVAAGGGTKGSVAAEPSSVTASASTVHRQGAVELVEIERRDIPAPGEQWSASHLSVSEILPASGGEHMAIVNGLPVMEGTSVEGAVIREIYPDRVIFSIDGKSVTVPVSGTR